VTVGDSSGHGNFSENDRTRFCTCASSARQQRTSLRFSSGSTLAQRLRFFQSQQFGDKRRAHVGLLQLQQQQPPVFSDRQFWQPITFSDMRLAPSSWLQQQHLLSTAASSAAVCSEAASASLSAPVAASAPRHEHLLFSASSSNNQHRQR
jgi:hypothetical protein